MDRVTLADLATGWRFDPAAAAVVVLAAALYGRGVRRLAARGRRWPVGRSVAWGASLLLAVLATQSGIGRYDTTQLEVHMVQHLLLGMAVPLTAVLGAPLTLALQTGRAGTRALLRTALRQPWARFLTHPVVTWALFGGGLVVVYLTPVLGLSARNGWVHLAVHAHLVLSGSLFFAGLVGPDPMPRPLPHGARLLSILTAVPFHAFLGLALTSAREPFVPEYPSLADQHRAGALLWGMGELLTLVVAAVVVRQWYVADQRAAARADRRADAAVPRH